MAAYGITLAIALFSGALCGFLSSLLPHPRQIFDDDENFENVNYGDDLDKYNPDPEAEMEMEQIPDTARTERDEIDNGLDIKDIVGPASDSFKTDEEESNSAASSKQVSAI